MKNLDIFTDGSHLDKLNNGRLGCGGVMVDRSSGEGYGVLLDKFGEELTSDYLENNFGSSKCSNPTAELIGVLRALQNFKIPSDAKITIHADYIGVKSWMEGKWRINESYLKEVKKQIDAEIKKQKLTGRIFFEWVKGHQTSTNGDAYWNNKVDLLAKGQSI